ncbi:MAG TPA: hypothetical protein VG722_01740 [Tepidisphaeraceae bacterium]|nr:hypothetical protein [Tepidisphaeraceae bacterium]
MKRIAFFSILISMIFASAAVASSAPRGQIDILNYFLQNPKIAGHFTIGGVSVHPNSDPDGTHHRVLVLDKFDSPDTYEVYYLTPTQLQLRYEVMRSDPHGSSADWIRRYRPIGPGADASDGALWMPRYVIPGQTSYLVHYTVDRYQFDPAIRAYLADAPHCEHDLHTFNSVVWADDPWGLNNHTGVKIDRVLRLISQWHPEGAVIERYDYARGLGLVNWQWLQRLSTLNPVDGDKTGRIFSCENGAVYIQSRGNAVDPPSVLKYDLKTHAIGSTLPVVLFTSHWAPELGPQWYVVYRDLSREDTLEKVRWNIKQSYALPEWFTHPDATIADLPKVDYQTAP